MGGEVFVTDCSDDEEGEAGPQLIRCQETSWVDIHVGREARWLPLDVAGARPIVVFSLLKRFLSRNGFSVRLVWGRLDRRRGIFRTPKPMGCGLDRPQMLTDADLVALGIEPPDSQPLIHCWADSPCHGALVDWSATEDPWVHGWDVEHPALLAQLYVLWEIAEDDGRAFVPLTGALESVGPRAIAMYLLGSHYGELLAPIDEGLPRAAEHVKRIDAALARMSTSESSPPELARHREAFEDALADDLDTPTALLSLFDWIREARAMRCAVGDSDLRAMLWMLGMAPSSPAAPRGRSRRSRRPASSRRTA